MEGILLNLFVVFGLFTSNLNAQQKYSGNSVLNCSSPSGTGPSLDFLYSCNGERHSCQSFLIFRSQFPYNSVTAISSLTSSDPLKLAAINNVSDSEIFPSNKEVIIPVDCSCSNWYYQANSSYVISSIYDTYFNIANLTYQGLSTCSILMLENVYDKLDLKPGLKLQVPLRCACPTKNQTVAGTKFLLTYLVTWGDSINEISKRFNVSASSVVYANGFSNDVLFPFTTILVPLSTPPLSSQTIISNPQAVPPASPYHAPPPLSVSSPYSSSSRTWIYVVVGAVGGGGLVLLIGIIVLSIFFCKITKKADPSFTSESFKAIEENSQTEEAEAVGIDPKELLESISSIAQSLKVYSFEELLSATDNFSPNCWIKGSVYQGTFKGHFAAIKKVDGDVSEEINVLNKISHFNLIRLLGFCFDQGHWYLIYEYAINGSLTDWIGNNNVDEKFLSWTQRMQIALDVATGLNYIHNYTSPPCVHKDVKSSNVLLDSDFRAKIANFSMARSAENGEFALTRHIVGTKGYMAPEYLENGLISTKLDIYAFGVLMLELLTGKEAAILYEWMNKQSSEVLSGVLDKENGMENCRNFMDPSLKGNYPSELVVYVARLAQNCINRDQFGRPGMDNIVQSLLGIVNSSLDWEMSNSTLGY